MRPCSPVLVPVSCNWLKRHGRVLPHDLKIWSALGCERCIDFRTHHREKVYKHSADVSTLCLLYRRKEDQPIVIKVPPFVHWKDQKAGQKAGRPAKGSSAARQGPTLSFSLHVAPIQGLESIHLGDCHSMSPQCSPNFPLPA